PELQLCYSGASSGSLRCNPGASRAFIRGRHLVNRDAKTQSALVALARTRRMQRALAHAYLHQHAPLPTLRLSLGFMTTTTRTTEEIDGDAVLGHRMTV